MSNERKIIARGIVIARYAAGEGSVRVVVYTDVLGLIVAVAQSAREERSQLRAHLQVGTCGTFSLVKGRDVWRMTGATSAENIYFELGEAPFAQKAAARVLSFVRQFVRGEGNDPYFFSSLWGFFELLKKVKEEDVQGLESVTVLRLLAALGYVETTPNLSAFLEESYEPSLFVRASTAHGTILRVINEGMSASGLSS